MTHPLVQRLLLCLLAPLVGLTSTAARHKTAVLCVATGDHEHVTVEMRHDAGGHHTVLHTHAHDGAESGGDVDTAHVRACIDIRLPAGDLRPGGTAFGDLQEAAATFNAPVAHLPVAATRPMATPSGYDTHPPGLAPPELLRSIILLI